MGRHFGTRLLATRIFARRQQGLQRGQQVLRDKGGRSVFLARFTAFLRAVMPGLAGTARMPYPRFLAFNAAGGLIWAVGFTLLGYLAGASYQKAEKIAGQASAILLAILVLAVLVIVVHRRRRREQADTPPDDAQPDDRTSSPP